MTTRLAGTINLGEERQQRTYGTGRRCACGCGTVLSRYNSGHFAYAELDPHSSAVVALANAEAEWIDECWNAVARAFGERGLL